MSSKKKNRKKVKQAQHRVSNNNQPSKPVELRNPSTVNAPQEKSSAPPDYFVNNSLAHAAGYSGAIFLLITIGLTIVTTAEVEPEDHRIIALVWIALSGGGAAFFAYRWGVFGLAGHTEEPKKQKKIVRKARSAMSLSVFLVYLDVRVVEREVLSNGLWVIRWILE